MNNDKELIKYSDDMVNLSCIFEANPSLASLCLAKLMTDFGYEVKAKLTNIDQESGTCDLTSWSISNASEIRSKTKSSGHQ